MFTFPKTYDVIVVGGGHAGIEAALASARVGAETALLTQNLDTIGQMSCNPAIGGLGKGHMVREIDALGGFMGLNTDATGIQFRMLNANKGPSARAPRAQCDKKAYQFRAKHALEASSKIDLHQGGVAELTVTNDTICGLVTDLGVAYTCRALVLSTGTFMRGLMHVGQESKSGGRMGDGKSTVSDALRRLGFDVARFKTGTPCRLHGKSIDYALLEQQNGDTPPPLFSFLSDTLQPAPEELFTLNHWGSETFHVEQIPCWIGYTNEITHEIIRANLDKSPMYSGKIEGIGPRYCPSIEDKVMRFASKERHQIFLEPEGRHTHEFYVNGVSTSLPMEVQYDFIRSIKGLEHAAIIRPGYAVEYDYCPPAQLQPTLETKRIAGLYFAGQINGTSGYEEAAGQGLIAGANAALAVAGKSAFTLERDEAYLGVMIDDLTTKSVLEPYRMFTSRAEFRLLLRQDNADLRLTEKAATHGLVPSERLTRTLEKRAALEQATHYANSTSHAGERIARWLKRSSNTAEQLPGEHRARFPVEIWNLLQIEIKYGGYLDRQLTQIERSRKMADRHLPEDLCYHEIKGLKREAQLRLEESRPQNLGQASRLQGVTPADISVLTVYLTRRERASQAITSAVPES